MSEICCLICGDILSNNYTDINTPEINMSEVKLKCGHCFHYSCIYSSYKYSNNKKCPYCRQDGGNLYIKKNIKLCTAIIKTGKNKGNICNCKILKNDEIYCGRHSSNKNK